MSNMHPTPTPRHETRREIKSRPEAIALQDESSTMQAYADYSTGRLDLRRRSGRWLRDDRPKSLVAAGSFIKAVSLPSTAACCTRRPVVPLNFGME